VGQNHCNVSGENPPIRIDSLLSAFLGLVVSLEAAGASNADFSPRLRGTLLVLIGGIVLHLRNISKFEFTIG
jgi:hypothetical protein